VVVREVLPENREGRPAGRPSPPWLSQSLPIPILTSRPPGPVRTGDPQLPGLGSLQPTVTVTTRLSLTVTTGPGATTTSQPQETVGETTVISAFPPSGSPSGSQTVPESSLTDMPTLPVPHPTSTEFPDDAGPTSGSSDGIGANRTLIITLSTVLSTVALLLILAVVLLCRRRRRGRFPFVQRGVSPIDDDEIATWKVPRGEKDLSSGGGLGHGEAAEVGPAGSTTLAGAMATMGAVGSKQGGSDSDGSRGTSSEVNNGHRSKQASTSSVKKPPSVIVYSNAHGKGGYRHSTDDGSPRSCASFDAGPTPPYSRKMSLDKALPQTPIQAKAPNARVGLTDESVPGDDPFIASPKRQPSRLSKLPPGYPPSQRRTHVRARSSRSSFRSYHEYAYGGSEHDLSQRHSHDNIPRTAHWRVYSSSTIPPRLSFSDDSMLGGNLSPRPLLAEHEIGRAT